MIFSINRIIIFLILSNFFIESAFGFIAPVFSVFIVDEVTGGTLAVAGFAATIYWVVKSVIQLLVAKTIDKTQSEKANVIAVVLGHTIMATGAFLYLTIETSFHIYIVQFVLALGAAISTPSWYVLFSHHLDKLKETFEWSLNSSITFGLGVGLASAIGGVIAEILGFNAVFILAGVVGVLGAFVLIPIYRYLEKTHEEYPEVIKS